MGLGGLTIAATTSAMTDERRLSHGVSHDMAMVVMDPWWNSNLKKYRNHKYVRIVVSKYTYVCMILRYIISQCIYIYTCISKTLGTSYIRQYQYPDFWLVGSACSVGKEHV